MEIREGQHREGESLKEVASASPQKSEIGAATFDEIYREYGERILYLLYRFVPREQAARDLLQDVFVKVYENLDSFEQRSQIYTWIYRIAVNHALNYLKRERRGVWVDLMDESVGELLRKEKIEAPGFGDQDSARPDEVLERSESEALVARAIDSLAPKYKVPFLLYRDEHLSYAEIAKVLQMNGSSVASRIHRARKLLIRKIGPFIK